MIRRIFIIVLLIFSLQAAVFAGGSVELGAGLAAGAVIENAGIAYVIDKTLSTSEATSNYWGTFWGAAGLSTLICFTTISPLYGSITAGNIIFVFLGTQIIGGYLGHEYLLK